MRGQPFRADPVEAAHTDILNDVLQCVRNLCFRTETEQDAESVLCSADDQVDQIVLGRVAYVQQNLDLTP